MAYAPFAEKGFAAGEGPVDELVDNDEVARRGVFPQGAASRKRNDVGNSDALEGIDVRAVRNGRRRMNVAPSVPRQEGQSQPVELAGENFVRRVAPRSIDFDPFRVAQARDVVNAGTADHAQNPFLHC